jgi:hypothetical protein
MDDEFHHSGNASGWWRVVESVYGKRSERPESRVNAESTTLSSFQRPGSTYNKASWGQANYGCTICERAVRNQVQTNPDLCSHCQDWEDIIHLVYCQEKEYEAIHPIEFSAPREKEASAPWRPFGSVENLNYYGPETFDPNSRCVICRRVGDTLRIHIQSWRNMSVAVWRALPIPKIHRAYRKDPEYSQQVLQKIKCVLPLCVKTIKKSGLRRRNSPSYKPLIMELMLQYEHNGYGLRRVDRWDRRFIDTGFLVQWLAHCQNDHDDKCNELVKPEMLPRNFRLIDTTRKCIADYPTSPVSFAALSYVWSAASIPTKKQIQLETKNLDAMTKNGALSGGGIPQVINDAIQLCLDLKIQYLWVDRLCIVQDDPVSKHSQIAAMDIIYSFAEATIVAVTDSGLPGVTTRPRDLKLEPRSWYLMMDRDGDYLTPSVVPVSIEDAVDKSKWNTRGWTYQERKLARRHIFVSETQVYVSCYHDKLSEDGPLAAVEQFTFPGTKEGFEKGVRPQEDLLPFDQFKNAVEEYNIRQLSFTSDILDAFTGVGNKLAARMTTSLIFGLPEKYICHALFWGYSGSSGRRDEKLGIPSWSWAAWEGAITYSYSNKCVGATEDSLTWTRENDSHFEFGNIVKVFYSDPQEGVRPLTEALLWFSQTDLAAKSDQALRTTYISHLTDQSLNFFLPYTSEPSAPWEIDRLHQAKEETVKLWQNCVHNPWEALSHRELDSNSAGYVAAKSLPGCLIFNSTCATLRLTPTDLKDSVEEDDITDITCDIITHQGVVIGQTVPMNMRWAFQAIDLDRDFKVAVFSAAYFYEFMKLYTSPWFYKHYEHSESRQRQDPLEIGQPPAWNHLRSQPWSLCVLIMEQKGAFCHRLTVGIVDLCSWTEIKPQWETIVLA